MNRTVNRHTERHRTSRVGWLRAAVLGANDGIVSTASLIIGVAAANASHGDIVMTGVAGLAAGAMSMAAGEYVSVHSQSDVERADLAREQLELAEDPDAELRELSAIYVSRGLPRPLALEVAQRLSEHDALGAHAREELGIHETTSARPFQAAMASAGSFSVGAALPLVVAWLAPEAALSAWVAVTSIAFLAGLGGMSAHAGGAAVMPAAWRVMIWGALAMAVTAGAGTLFAGIA